MKSPNKNGKSKKTVLHFTAGWIPGEGEQEDPNCSMTGVIQVVDDKPTDQPAHVVLRDYDDRTPCWWPGVTIPAKKQISYGAVFADEEPNGTNLHQVKIAKGSSFTVTSKDGTVARYQIEKVEDLAG